MKRQSMLMPLALTATALSTTAHAGLIVDQSADLPAAWPSRAQGVLAPSTTTMLPNAGTVSNEADFNGVLSQTFTPTETYKLDALAMVGSGTNNVRYSVHLFQFDPNGGYVPATSGGYVPDTSFVDPTVDLLGGGSGLTFVTAGTTANSDRVLTFDLTGADEITLTAGTTYAFELWNLGDDTTGADTGSYFFRRAGETYAGGSLFTITGAGSQSATSTVSRNNVAGGTRDAVFTTYAATAPVPEPATMAALGLGAAALLRRRRKSA